MTDDAAIKSLSSQEIVVLRCLANGMCGKGTARMMQLSPRTIDGYRANIMNKLGVASSIHAVAIAFYRGILTKDDIYFPMNEKARQKLARLSRPLISLS